MSKKRPATDTPEIPPKRHDDNVTPLVHFLRRDNSPKHAIAGYTFSRMSTPEADVIYNELKKLHGTSEQHLCIVLCTMVQSIIDGWNLSQEQMDQLDHLSFDMAPLFAVERWGYWETIRMEDRLTGVLKGEIIFY
jgi:hypothetical protein